ncbi:unnamed protein product [Bursaphelenchus xylophilus]|nr:unnamed protein product [Bursaphelenchus xylophilus]CAG9115776.1 unnamed protein product [Bursaphelenchus xylophilus]
MRRPVEYNNDMFCYMPFRMRMMCFVCTAFLVVSLVTAIANSMKNSTLESATYCSKEKEIKFHSSLFCPDESILYYYKCCQSKCCAQPKILLL